MFHNPANVYAGGAQPGDYQILPHVQTFKYTPSFLILFAPFLSLSYRNALEAFDFLQLALIPALAFFVYKLVKEKNVVLGSVAAVIVLLDPLPSILMNSSTISLNLASFAPTYYLGYALVNAHILQTILLVGALYFGFAKKPWASALAFTFGAFDPRGALLALPLLLWYNKQNELKFVAGTAAFLAATNVPFFFYHGIGFSFLATEVNRNIVSQMYQYDWIPLYSVAALTAIELINYVVESHKIHFSFSMNKKKSEASVRLKP